MARNLKKLSHFYYLEEYERIAAQSLRNIVPQIAKYASAYSNWVMLLMEDVFGVYEIAVTGEGFEGIRREIENTYIPNKIMLGGKQGSLPLLQDKFGTGTQIFICKDKVCGLPATNTADALKQIATDWVEQIIKPFKA